MVSYDFRKGSIKRVWCVCAGHQKKLMLAVKRLAELQHGSEGRGSFKKKPPPITQQQEVMSIESPPPDGEVIATDCYRSICKTYYVVLVKLLHTDTCFGNVNICITFLPIWLIRFYRIFGYLDRYIYVGY